MSEMVERVALAIWQAREARFPKFTQRREPDDFDRQSGAWAFCMEEARAAIEAMREPTKEMVNPGYEAMDENVDFYNYDSGAGYTIEASGPANVWRTMIDAVLASEPKP